VLTEIGPVQIQVPRDTDASFDPQIVKKRQRRLTGVDEIILSLSAKGLTTGEIAAHFDDVYGATVSKETISKIPRALRAGRYPHRQSSCRDGRMVRPAARPGVSGGSSSTRSTSRFATVRSPTGRSMWRSA